jgi:hypothetical protein
MSRNDDGWTSDPGHSWMNEKGKRHNDDMSTSGYEVGYGKPPKHTRFQKGRSGNDAGRPKVVPTASSVARKILRQKRRMSVHGEIVEITNLEALYLSAIAQAIKKGDHRATSAFHAMMTEEEPSSQPFKTNYVTIKLVRPDGKERLVSPEKLGKEK